MEFADLVKDGVSPRQTLQMATTGVNIPVGAVLKRHSTPDFGKIKSRPGEKFNFTRGSYSKLPVTPWKPFMAWVKATLPALGGVGVFLSAFLDSSFVPLPLVTDLIVVDLSSRNPLRMPYYAAMAGIGSVVGCIWIHALARKGSQANYRKKQQQPSGRVRKWVQ
jgi:hypothetical protein